MPYCLRRVFFRQNVTSPALVKVSAIFLQDYFSEIIQNFKQNRN